jgi:hypothetical protein
MPLVRFANICFHFDGNLTDPAHSFMTSRVSFHFMASSEGAVLTSGFHCVFQLPVRMVRHFDTFGPRQSLRAVIPAIVSQLADGASARLRPAIVKGDRFAAMTERRGPEAYIRHRPKHRMTLGGNAPPRQALLATQLHGAPGTAPSQRDLGYHRRLKRLAEQDQQGDFDRHIRESVLGWVRMTHGAVVTTVKIAKSAWLSAAWAVSTNRRAGRGRPRCRRKSSEYSGQARGLICGIRRRQPVGLKFAAPRIANQNA